MVGIDSIEKIISNIPDLIEEMRRKIPDERKIKRVIPRHVSAYAARGGGFYTTYGGKRVLESTIRAALVKGVLVPEWDDKPNLQHWKLREDFLK